MSASFSSLARSSSTDMTASSAVSSEASVLSVWGGAPSPLVSWSVGWLVGGDDGTHHK